MPAHIGLKEKLQIAWTFVMFNTSQDKNARNLRNQRVLHQKAKFKELGRDDNEVNRAKYLPIKYIERRFEDRRRRRQDEINSYGEFRRMLNGYDPHIGRGQTSDQTEWDLYLKPSTEFDRTCEEAFAAHYDTGFKMMLITHRSDVNKLKRIEAIFASGKIEYLWTDAS